MPFAFHEGGITPTVICVILIGFISSHTMYLLVEVRNEVCKSNPQVVTFSDLAGFLFGKWGSILLNFLLVVCQIGVCCLYVVFILHSSAMMLTAFTPNSPSSKFASISPESEWILRIGWFIVLSLMSLIRTLSQMSFISNCANFSILFSIIVILIASSIQLSKSGFGPNILQTSSSSVTRSQNYPIMIDMSIYAFESIGTVLPSITAMKKPQYFTKILVFVMVFSTLNYLIFGLVPYLAFGSDTSDEITSNLKNFAYCYPPHCTPNSFWISIQSIVSFFLIATIVGSFPLQLFVVTDLSEEWFFRTNGSLLKYKVAATNILRIFLVFLIFYIANSFPNFGLLMSLIGAVGGCTLQFIFPTLIALRWKWGRMGFLELMLYTFYLLFGVMSAAFGLSETIAALLA
jgi:amino acid permease